MQMGGNDPNRHLGGPTAEQPVREHYVVSVDPSTGALLPDDQLRTEIAWPITDH